MKAIYLIFLSVFVACRVLGQAFPGCTDLVVEQISLDAAAGQMNITIKNTCSNCSSGVNGCVYMELEVIRTVAPFDTVASSACYCLLSPENNSQEIYSLSFTAGTLPPLNEIRVSLNCGQSVGCDNIPFSSILAAPAISQAEGISFFPNPTKDVLFIQSEGASTVSVVIKDLQGRVVLSNALVHGSISISQLPSAMYILELRNSNSDLIKTAKLLKE